MQEPDNVIPFPSRDGSSAETELTPREWMDQFLASVQSGELDTSDALSIINRVAATGADTFDSFRPHRVKPELLRPGREQVCFVVRLDLDHASPPIWRRLRLASDLRLDQVHDIIQTAMGWTDSHLHHFQLGPDAKDFQMEPFLTPFDIEEGETEGIREGDVQLDQVIAKPGHRLFYEYDFGDSWHHTIKLEKVEPWTDGDPVAFCVTGRQACPPEDVGGIGGYWEVLEALAGRVEPGSEDWMAEKVAWMPPDFDPAAFDVDTVNELLLQEPLVLEEWHPEIAHLLARDRSRGLTGLPELVGRALADGAELDDDGVVAATRRYRVLLQAIGEGLQLTSAGYLPPATVASLTGELGIGREWISRGNRESQSLPVLTLRESATALGLVRNAKGRLSVTRAGQKLVDNPPALLDHVRARTLYGDDFERDAGLIGLLFVAAGVEWREAREAAGAVAADLGWVVADGDLAGALSYSVHQTFDVLDQLCGRVAPRETRAHMARVLLRRPV